MTPAAGRQSPGGEKKAGPRSEPAPSAASDKKTPYWKCSKCRYVLEADSPPDSCPSCHEKCLFVEVTCYIPECGFSGPDERLIGG